MSGPEILGSSGGVDFEPPNTPRLSARHSLCANPASSLSTFRPQIRVRNHGCKYFFLFLDISLRVWKSMANVSPFRSFRKSSTGKSPCDQKHHDKTSFQSENSITNMSCDNLAPSSRGTRSSLLPSSPVPSLLRCTSQSAYNRSFRMPTIANLGISQSVHSTRLPTRSGTASTAAYVLFLNFFPATDRTDHLCSANGRISVTSTSRRLRRRTKNRSHSFNL